MYAFIVDFVEFMRTGHVRYFLVFFVVVWVRWFVVNVPALLYRPKTARYAARKSVIIPVVDEDPKVFRAVLQSIQRQRPQETIVVINGPKNRALEKICDEYKSVSRRWTRKPGKRHAIALGMKYATGDIIVLVDSDTIWEKRMLGELIKPFADPRVGGVTTRQRITNPTQSLLTRVCDWLEDVRTHGTMQAMSVTGKVGCLPGRTIAFRADVLRAALPEFMREEFLGFHKEVSDDRSLTNLTLKAGYKTVLQSTAVVCTEAPTHWKQFLRQQLRWSEGSQYNNIRMSGWMLRHAKLMFFIYWTDMLVPFLLWGVYGSYLINYVFFHSRLHADLLINSHNALVIAAITLLGAYLSYAMRQLPAINERRSHLLFLPFYLLFLSFVMAPIRMIGFARLADDLGWGTRASGYTGAKARGLFRLPAGLFRIARSVRTWSSRAWFFIAQTVFFVCLVSVSLVLAFGGHPPEIVSAVATPGAASAITATAGPLKTMLLANSQRTPAANTGLKFGMYLDNPNPQPVEDKVGGKLDIIAWFSHWDQSIVNNKLRQSCASGYVPEITWESWGGRAGEAYDAYPLSDIASGAFDDLITRSLKRIRTTCGSQTVLIRFDHEMDTVPGAVDWYPWQGDPLAYIAAWRHVVDVSRAADPAVMWIWAPNRGTATAAAYYPGDQWVDYVGITLNHGAPEAQYQSFADFYSANKAAIESYHKPVIVAETTTSEALGEKALWILDMFAYARQDPNIVALVWFNGNTDYAFDSSSASAQAFRQVLPLLHTVTGVN